VQSITKDYNNPFLGSTLHSIMVFFLGTIDDPGALEQLGTQFESYEPIEWAKQMEALL
jgi:hypothetical protein